MGCGRSKSDLPYNYVEIITSIDESKDGITFNELEQNIVVRFRQITDIPSDNILIGASLINHEKQSIYYLASSTVLDGTPKRLKLIYKGCSPTVLNKGNCYPINGDIFIFNYTPPTVGSGSVTIRRTCGKNTVSEIEYKSGVEGFTEKCTLLPNEYAVY